MSTIFLPYFSLYRPEHSFREAEQRLYRDSIKEAEKKMAAGKKNEALHEYGQAVLEHRGNQQKIDNPITALPRNCPEGPEIVDNVWKYNLVGCKERKLTQAQFGLPRQLEKQLYRYKVLLTNEGVAVEPVIVPINDGFSVARKNSDGTWTMREDLVLKAIHGGVLTVTPFGPAE